MALETEIFDPNVELVTRFDYISGNEDLYSKRSKLFIAQTRDTKRELIVKRVIGRQYCKNEWELPSRIDDPSIIKFNSVVHDGEYHYFISDYEKTSDLFSLVADRCGRLSESELMEILMPMAYCLKLCHDKDILHLDIKMENYLVRKEEPLEIILIDFGFARDASDTKMETANGTDFYVAPEILDYKSCSKKSDVYSLGKVMVYLSTEFGDDDTVKQSKLLRKINRSSQYSTEYKELVSKMVKLKPSDRLTIDEVYEYCTQFFAARKDP